MCEWTSIFATSTTGDSWGDQEGLRSGQWFLGGVCVPALVIFWLCQPKERSELGCFCLYLMQALNVGVVEGSTFSVAPFVTSHVSIPYMSVCLWDPRSASLLVDCAKGRVAATSLSLGWAPGWGPAAGDEVPGLGLPEEATTPNVIWQKSGSYP